MLPRDDTVGYHDGTTMYCVKELVACRLEEFAFDMSASTKTAPGAYVSNLLVDEILTRTFVTDGDPILVYHRASVDLGGPFHWLLVKGHARISNAYVVLLLLCLWLDFDLDRLQLVNRDLWHSFCCIWARVEFVLPDYQTVAFRNAQLSAAGSIRRKHDVFTWVAKIRGIMNATANRSVNDVISKWFNF